MAYRWKFQLTDLSRWFALLLGSAVILGCSASADNYTRPASTAGDRVSSQTRQTHTVARGETVYRIARQYGVSPSLLMSANGLSDPRNLSVGQILMIPGHPLAAASITGIPEQWTAPRADREFAWPVTGGVLSSPFGLRAGAMHEGIDIAAPVGTPVDAADTGTVIFAGHLHGYGNVVIVQHPDGYVTVYGHNQQNLAHEGEHVARGQEIAEVGATGRASGPNLHFEVRYDNRPQNPIAYLPTPGLGSGISFARNTGY